MTSIPNIILFGESGSGKSSIINMLSTGGATPISNGVELCTLESEAYQVNVLGKEMTLWDTSGLDDGETGRVPSAKAIANLYNLLLKLKPGISLLVFVTRPRIKGSSPILWKLFHKIICEGSVPIVILVTGLEEESDRESWWRGNKAKLHSYGMFPDDHACITASRGKAGRGGYVYDQEFEDSKATVQKLLGRRCLEEPWRVHPGEWFKKNFEVTYETRFFGVCPQKRVQTCKTVEGCDFRRLVEDCGMSKEEAYALARKLEGKLEGKQE